jgi:hypothetical protein
MRGLLEGPRKSHPKIRHRMATSFDDPQRIWYDVPFKLTVGGICREHCNNGWMSELENNVKPFLQYMITGHRVRLDEQQTKWLATWITMKAMVFQLTMSERPIQPNAYRYLHDHQRPHPSAQVWLAARTDEESPFSVLGLKGSFVGKSRDDPERFHAYLAPIVIGHFVAEVFGHNLPLDFNLVREGPFAPALKGIWPSGGPVEWPPTHIIRSVQVFAEDRSTLNTQIVSLLEWRGTTVKREDPK